MNGSGSRRCAKPLGRYVQVAESDVLLASDSEKEKIIDNDEQESV